MYASDEKTLMPINAGSMYRHQYSKFSFGVHRPAQQTTASKAPTKYGSRTNLRNLSLVSQPFLLYETGRVAAIVTVPKRMSSPATSSIQVQAPPPAPDRSNASMCFS